MYLAMSGIRFLFRTRCHLSSGVNSIQSVNLKNVGIALSFMTQAKYLRCPMTACMAGNLTFIFPFSQSSLFFTVSERTSLKRLFASSTVPLLSLAQNLVKCYPQFILGLLGDVS